ncbi:MAG: rRNA cytosine-C5-methyltransferase [Bacteroidales bacterium]|nr:rRNA cytosine-C5-methyltransferase [Bacteroidales bacterium]
MDTLPVSIRLNPFKFRDREGSSVPWNPMGRILAERPVFTLDPLFHAGAYYVQDSSAMFVGHVFRGLELFEGIRVLDLCAAPGGKTTDISASLRQVLGDRFLLVGNEVMRQRASVLCDNVARWGDPNVVVTGVDPAAFAGLGGFFDIIVADVPCSGEGMFRKDPKAGEQWSQETVALCAARQKRILADVWPALKKGGFLLYSTCTYNEQENDLNLRWAAANLGGDIVEPKPEFEEAGVRLTDCGHLLKAGESLGEGQWAGLVRKTSSSAASAPESALDRLHPLRKGIRKGQMKGTEFVPDSDWALSLDFESDAWPAADVDRQTALKYLHRDTIALPDAPKGYNVIRYDGLPLGFVKNLGNRCNNLLPARRRILMDIK